MAAAQALDSQLCVTCVGLSRAAGVDCTGCGGSSLQPPLRPPDRHCYVCERPLWLDTLQCTLWYEHVRTKRAVCRWCMPRGK